MSLDRVGRRDRRGVRVAGGASPFASLTPRAWPDHEARGRGGERRLRPARGPALRRRPAARAGLAAAAVVAARSLRAPRRIVVARQRIAWRWQEPFHGVDPVGAAYCWRRLPTVATSRRRTRPASRHRPNGETRRHSPDLRVKMLALLDCLAYSSGGRAPTIAAASRPHACRGVAGAPRRRRAIATETMRAGVDSQGRDGVCTGGSPGASADAG